MIDAMFESPTDGIKNIKISKAYAASKIEQSDAQHLKAS
jgi:ATP-dependent Clp protease ATP-binding subunit ClpX